MRAWCAICLSYGPGLRPRQLVEGGPIFILCGECDEADAATIRRYPPRFTAPRRGQAGGWQRRTYHPLDESERDLAFRILRAIQRFDWINSMELSDLLAIPSVTVDRRARNAYSVALSRLARNRFLSRRLLDEWIEYRITPLGRARIENWTRAAVEEKRSIAA